MAVLDLGDWIGLARSGGWEFLAMAIVYALGVQCSLRPLGGSGRVRGQCRQRRGAVVAMSVQKTSKKVSVAAEKLLHEVRGASATPLPLLHQVADALVEEMNAGLANLHASTAPTKRTAFLPSTRY